MIGIVLAAALASSTSRFDLICTGMQHHEPGGAMMPWSARMRVDLVAKTYCGDDGACKGPSPIAEVGPAAIMFRDYTGPQLQDLTYVSRSTGEFSSSARFGDGSADVIKGNCKRAAFSGMPKTKF